MEELQAPQKSAALEDLKDLVQRKLVYVFSRDTSGYAPASNRYTAFRRLDVRTFAEDIAQEAVMRITSRLHTFRGESKFISWSMRIAINLAYTELRKRHWKDLSLDALAMPKFPINPSLLIHRRESPEAQAVKRNLIAAVNRAVRENLTEHQQTALVAIAVHGVPMEEVASRLGTNRNALYKTMHDARKRLKKAMESYGFTAEDVADVLS